MSKNIFFTKFSELSGERYDPNTYHYERLNAIEKLKKSSLKLEKLKYITKLDKKIVTTNDKNLPYIGLTNIESNTGIYTKGTEKEAFSSAVQFDKGQVLFPKLRPYLNKVYFADFDGLCSTEFHIFDSNIIDNKYLSIFLQTNLVVAQTKHLMSGNTLPRLQTEDIENLLIPIPSSNIQNKIISKTEEAYKLKEQKEREAQNKLDSIDNYLLNALGIEVPSSDKESLGDRVFLRKFSGISGDRYDSSFNSIKNNYYKNIISKYKNISFSQLNQSMQTGLPIRKDNRETNGRHPYYGANGIIGYMNEFTHDGKYLIIGQDGYIGNHYVVNGKFWASNHNWVIKLNDDVNINYIKYFLDVWNYDYLITGGVIPKITKDAVNSIKIPLPPIEIQNKIANHIQQLRDEAKILKDEAIQIYEDTKKEVEDIILGDEL